MPTVSVVIFKSQHFFLFCMSFLYFFLFCFVFLPLLLLLFFFPFVLSFSTYIPLCYLYFIFFNRTCTVVSHLYFPMFYFVFLECYFDFEFSKSRLFSSSVLAIFVPCCTKLFLSLLCSPYASFILFFFHLKELLYPLYIISL